MIARVQAFIDAKAHTHLVDEIVSLCKVQWHVHSHFIRDLYKFLWIGTRTRTYINGLCWKLCKEYKWEVILICEKSYLDLIMYWESCYIIIMGNGSVMVPYGDVIIICIIWRQKKRFNTRDDDDGKTSVNHLSEKFSPLSLTLIISNQNNCLILNASSNETTLL